MEDDEILISFEGLTEWERLIAIAVSLLPNDEETLRTMEVEDLEHLFRTLYAIVATVEGIASERIASIRDANLRARAAIRMYERAETDERHSFDLAKAA